MGLLDDIKDKVGDVMDDPDKRAKIEEIAKEKGLTLDQAKEHFLNHNDEKKDE
ncbi:MAG: hypothetical protein JWN33_178 [Candidatus Saccharibacteria bacterium]|nr:hypothetical protein [Candidatus Saccharibacteria bacterium]